ncbi:MAG: DUF4326 domain-containing protein [Desulfarculus sp.]|jgi:hypothetical protein|nr:MAG: DUF4326 domain-containing protein [Desulfarculus sp.]
MSMPCFAVWAPWGSLIMAGAKDVENRRRPAPARYTLPLEVLVYQGARWDHTLEMGRFVDLLGGQAQVAELLARAWQRERILGWDLIALWLGLQIDLARRAILGTVKITGCRQDSKSRWAAPGAWHWELADPKPFDRPVTYLAGRRANSFFLAPSPNEHELFKPHDGRTRRVDVRVECPDVMITQPGRWGNPFRTRRVDSRWAVEQWDRDFGQWVDLRNRYLKPYGPCDTKAAALGACIKAYESWLRSNGQLMARLPELKGKRLGCYCRADQPCHGDVLVRLAEET